MVFRWPIAADRQVKDLDVVLVGAAVTGLVGGLVAAAAGIQHLWDRYSKRGLYARVQRETTARLDHLADRFESAVIGVRDGLAGIPGELASAVATSVVKDTLREAMDPVAERVEKAVMDLGSALSGTVESLVAAAGAREMQERSVDSRKLNSMAKVGAKKMLASIAAQVHPVAGMAAGGLMATGILDDETAEQIAGWLLDNPDVMARINAAGSRLAERRGMLPSSNERGWWQRR